MVLTGKEREILSAIVVPSEDNPDRPEFPPSNPHWPSTPVKKIAVPSFPNVWLKDESVNPTGTHKDRMAWEIVVAYKKFLEAKEEGKISKLPQMSILSSGSAANAVQTMLSKYNLPNLKVLVDTNMEESVKQSLKKIGCELYETDLEKKALSPSEILTLTKNDDGIDITSDSSLSPTRVFYDWMSYDIINQDADYVFVPYGTGQLYENIINIALGEVNSKKHDKRFEGDVERLRKCNFLGATTNNPKTVAAKLYSPHAPFKHLNPIWTKVAILKGELGKASDIYQVQEMFFEEAMKIAEENNIVCEPSGIAGLALMLQMQDTLPKDKKMLIINTGKTRYK